MKKTLHFIALILTCLIAHKGFAQVIAETSMKLTSPDFTEGGTIPVRFTCEDQNVNPNLNITDVPKLAKGLVLIMDDPDAPAGTWTHWLVWKLKPDITEIPTNSVPQDAVQGLNDFKKNNYAGPCPPTGIHRYYFRLYAVDIPLNLPATANRKAVDKAIEGHILAEAILMGKYEKSDTAR